MRYIFVRSVFSLFAWHRYEVACGSFDNFQVPNHETVIESDSYVSPKLIFVDRKDSYFRNLHRDLLFGQVNRLPDFLQWALAISIVLRA